MINCREIVSYYKRKGIFQFFKTVLFSIVNPIYLYIKYSLLEIANPSALIVNASIPCRNFRFAKLDNLNWGDDINLILPELICGKVLIPFKYSISARLGFRKNFICIGSVLTWLTNINSHVWGAGVINPNDPLLEKPKRVYAVRGPLTRDYLLKNNVKCPPIYGDPALLFPKFYLPTINKKFKIGVIPHLTHKSDKIVQSMKDIAGVKVIDIVNYGKWTNFIDDVLSCDMIFSSSLHGLIIADAYSVPNRWISFSNMNDVERFKYIDYYQSVCKSIEYPFVMSELLDIDQLAAECNNWSPNDIALDSLLHACPFLES